MMTRRLLVVAAAIVVLSACSTRGSYEAIRTGQRNYCNGLPDTERERCLARTQDDFDTFNRKREEVLSQP